MKIELSDGNWIEYEHARMKNREVREWVRLEQGAEFTSPAYYRILAKFVKTWSFEGDPGDPKVWDELYFDQLQEIAQEIAKHFFTAKSVEKK